MRFGILGSGQLAWMLSLAAQKLGHSLRYIQQASDLESAHEKVDFLSFESEFLDFPIWATSLKDHNVYPAPALMQKLSDKWEQKKLFKQFELPSAAAELYTKAEAPTSGEFIAKWSRQGYDGYGNLMLNKKESSEQWALFYEKAQKQKSQIYKEALVPFEYECALVVARDINGNFLKYPLLITEQSNNVCHWVWGPAHSIEPALQNKADELWPKIQKFLNELNYVGVIAFEFFWVDGNLLVNEVAPRVHNSGHLSLDAFNFSQFDLHLLAPIGFGNIQLQANAPFFAMKNILGSEQLSLNKKTSVEKESENLILYWYGKDESRKGRKLGHFNYLSEQYDKEEIKFNLKKKEEELWQKLKKNP